MNTTMVRQQTRIRLLIDNSGSMAGQVRNVQQGYDDFMNSLCEVAASSPLVSCVTFDDEVEVIYEDKRPVEVPPFKYGVDGGTLLYDTVGQQVSRMEKLRGPDDRMVVVIMTDGGDTDSKEWNLDSLRRKIKKLEATGQWTFMFFGDDLGVGTGMGIKNVHSFLKLKDGVKGVFAEVTKQIVGLLTAPK